MSLCLSYAILAADCDLACLLPVDPAGQNSKNDQVFATRTSSSTTSYESLSLQKSASQFNAFIIRHPPQLTLNSNSATGTDGSEDAYFERCVSWAYICNAYFKLQQYFSARLLHHAGAPPTADEEAAAEGQVPAYKLLQLPNPSTGMPDLPAWCQCAAVKPPVSCCCSICCV
jgi:hypothetical protein